jgi:transposase
VTEETITLSHQELDRLSIIQSTHSRQLTQAEAALQLGIGIRQVKRLVRAYRTQGAAGLISGHRGKHPNNAIADAIRQQALVLVQERYSDFSPTFAHEKLVELHDLHFSVETLRKWMMAEGLWKAKSRKQAHIHQRRPRRPRLGELVQIDGSPHDWFEDRGPRCTLIVFIDDATSRLTALHFVPTETTQAYMETLREHLDQHGRPVAIYSDKHSIFRVNHPGKEGELTQFTRALKTLDIEPIHANTPQAKGRVERANQTFQDRLVKELRLQGIDTIEQANRFLPSFMGDYNQRFAVEPQHADDAHREMLHSHEELELILCLHHTRKLSKNLSLQFHNVEYQLQNYGKGYRLRGATVTVCEAFDGSVTLLHKGHSLTYRKLQQGEAPVPIVDEKSVHAQVEQAKQRQRQKPAWKPPPDHPWRHSIIGPVTSQT